MSDQNNVNRAVLVPAGPNDCVPLAAANPLDSRGLAEVVQGRWPNGTEIDCRPDAAAFFDWGNAWFDKEDYDKAIAEYDKAIRLDPKNSACYYNRGLALLRKKEFEKAIRNYDEALSVDPHNAAFYYYRGHAFSSAAWEWFGKNDHGNAIGGFEQAIRDLGEAVRLGLASPLALLSEAKCRLKLLLRLKMLCSANGMRQHGQAICQELFEGKIEQVLKTLTYREREIIKLRYGLGDGYTYTLEEVGRIFKVTRKRVRQIEAKAVRKLQHPVRSRVAREFFDMLAILGLSGQSPHKQRLRFIWPMSQRGQDLVLDRLFPPMDADPAFDTRLPPPDRLNDREKAVLLARPVTELGLSVRAAHGLTSAGITTYRDLVLRTSDELLEIRNLGETRIREVREKLRQLGLSERPKQAFRAGAGRSA